MVSSVVEVTFLEGIDLEGAPPCVVEFVDRETGDAMPCGQPSAVRILFRCTGCGNGGPRFYCQECYEDLEAGFIDCYYCQEPLTVIKEI